MTDRRIWLAKRQAPVLVAVLLAVLLAVLGGCSSTRTESKPPQQPKPPQRIVLATTTSTQDSGLLDVLVPAFEKAYPAYTVDVVAVGTGEALRLGEQKDADVLLVHARADEEAFVAKGFGIERRDVCYNRFVLVGPAADPADVAHASGAADALARIAKKGSPFVSRGDDSGTHKKEKSLWAASGVKPGGAWYIVTGQGMGETLKVASEKQAYTLTDEATYLTMKDSLDLSLLLGDDPSLYNQYGVIPVTGARNEEGARAFADWICGPEGQRLIGSFGVDRFGRPLFTPNAPGGEKS
ncbi:MAG: substrate-binding domain-containing protein [Anaerosomatales bacterium]|nr:substrate-binding domain-containing protein [Coriobacteriia bacterium]MDI6692327.1 substrate-binding domain-containing protein [Anaerosomatales bacterium]MDI6843470.1 substrate-binding domain-containing protein [Anaerosomatales bacterium]